MYKKALTIDCPSCKKMIISDQYMFHCLWGKAKKMKILDNGKSAAKKCKLTR